MIWKHQGRHDDWADLQGLPGVTQLDYLPSYYYGINYLKNQRPDNLEATPSICYSNIMKPINISSLMKKYGPGYIAKHTKSGKVVAHAKKLDVLFKMTKKRSDVVISWIPKYGTRYVFLTI